MERPFRLWVHVAKVKQAALAALFLLAASDCADEGDAGNRARMKAAATAAALRHQFDDPARPDSLRLAAGRSLVRLDPEFLASRYARQPVLVRGLIDEAVAAGDTTALPLVARLFEIRGGEERIDFEVDLIAFGGAARSRLVEMLGRSDGSLVVRAANVLARTGALEASADIAPLLQHRDDWIRIGAAHALGQLETGAATQALLTALSDTVYTVVNAALVGLAKQHSAMAYEPALALLGDDRPEVRKHAAHALGEIGNPAALEVLGRVSREDPNSGVRFMASRALQALRDVK